MLGKTNAITTNVPLSSCFPRVFIAERDIIWYGASVWVSCAGYVPSQPAARPGLPAASVLGTEAEQALGLCEHCSATAPTPLRYQRCGTSAAVPPVRYQRCGTSAVLVARTKGSSTRADLEKVTSTPGTRSKTADFVTTPYSLGCHCMSKLDESCSCDRFKTFKEDFYTIPFFYSLGFCSSVYCISLYWHTPLYSLDFSSKLIPLITFKQCISFSRVNVQRHLNCL